MNNRDKKNLAAFPVDVSADDIEEMEMEPPPASWSDTSKVKEENFFQPTETVEGDWSETEIPAKDRENVLRTVPKEVRREVRRAHYGLGHPTRATLIRMLKLGGDSAAALAYAKKWQ